MYGDMLAMFEQRDNDIDEIRKKTLIFSTMQDKCWSSVK
jgi:hypothetical protein